MKSAIDRWLRDFAAAVRHRNYTAAAKLFEPNVVGFGTVVNDARGIDALVAGQWRIIWAASRNFDFDFATCHREVVGNMAWAAARWSSSGLPGSALPRRRAGRATIVLRRINRRWRAVHSHFSVTPRIRTRR